MAEISHNVETAAGEGIEIAGRSVVVTGGTTGIGRAVALRLAAEGARVLIFGRHEKELEDALADIRNVSDQVHGITADVSNHDDVLRVFAEVDEKLGELDFFINNAALAAEGVTEMSFEDSQYVVQTNLLGYMVCANEAVKRMKARGEGHIVNIGSMSADVREEGSSVYVATKAGIQGFSESLRKEVNKLGIKVTLIEPGSVGTDMVDKSVDEQKQQQEAMKMLKAEDIAACVVYCLTQPKRCDVVTVQIRPHLQEI